MIKNIIFDAYGTLISTGDGSIKATRKIWHRHDAQADAAAIYHGWKRYHRYHIDALTEFITEKEIFIRDLQQLYEQYHIASNASADIEPMIASQYGRDVFPETRSVINELQSSYYVVIGSTTDTEPIMYNLNRADLHITHVFTSEMLRVYKPQKEFYLAILDTMGWEACDTLFVGDSLTDDVLGPKSVGMKAVLLDRNNKYSAQTSVHPDGIIQNLTQLKALIPTL